MNKFFGTIICALLLGGALPAQAQKVGKENCGDMCDAFQHPRARTLKPLPCIPIKFDLKRPGPVALKIEYVDGTTWRDSKVVSGTSGQFCYGMFRLHNAKRLELCSDTGKAWFDADNPAHVALALLHDHGNAKKGLYMCLKGTECSTRSPAR